MYALTEESPEPAKKEPGVFAFAVVRNAEIFILLSLVAGIAAGLPLFVKGSAALHLDKVDIEGILTVLNAMVTIFGLMFLTGFGRNGKTLLQPHISMRAIPIIIFVNLILAGASAGFLFHEAQSTNWKTVVGQVQSMTEKVVQTKHGYIRYPIITATYKVENRDLEATILCESTENPTSSNKQVLLFYKPSNPHEVSLIKGLSGLATELEYSVMAALAIAVAATIKLLVWQKELAQIQRESKSSQLGTNGHKPKSISAQADGTHIRLYDPIPGAEQHEVILKDHNANNEH